MRTCVSVKNRIKLIGICKTDWYMYMYTYVQRLAAISHDNN